MPRVDVNAVLGIANTALPAILALIKQRVAEAQPDAPALTDAQAFTLLHDTVIGSLAKDDAIAADIRRRNPSLAKDE